MGNVLIINGHQPYPFAKGELNAARVQMAEAFFAEQGHEIRKTIVADGYAIESEVEKHQWANIIMMQFPVNWMMTPWVFKKYMDEVYSAGMDGRLCDGDGRTAEKPKENYGTGGALSGTHYMLSVTLNAPKEAFNNTLEPFFEGISLDQLLLPTHLNAKFFGMSHLPSFGAFDVMKNADIENDFKRFENHLRTNFPS